MFSRLAEATLIRCEIKMPRYFFNCPDDALPHDKEGVELRDLAKAKAEAIVFVGESLKDKPQDLCRHASFQVDVTDDKGLILFSVVAITVDAPVIEIEHLASEAPLQRAFN